MAKIVQVSAFCSAREYQDEIGGPWLVEHEDKIVALCDDGKVLMWHCLSKEWEEIDSPFESTAEPPR